MNEENSRTHMTAGIITIAVVATVAAFTIWVFPIIYNFIFGD